MKEPMELLEIITGLTSTLLGLLVTWHWYDKRTRDKRFDAVDRRITSIERRTHENDVLLQVMSTKLDGLRDMTDLKLSNLTEGTQRIEALLNRKNEV